MRVGTIHAVGLDGPGVLVELSIDRDTQLPDGVTAAVRRKSAAGEPYVALEPPDGYDGGGPFVDPGEDYTIDEGSTSIPLSYGELFSSVDDLVGAIPPDDLDTVVHELATALEGRGLVLRRLLESGEDLTTTVAARADLLDELAGELTDLTHTIAESREQIGGSFDDVAALVATLAASSDDIDALLDRAPTLGRQVDDLLQAAFADLGCTVDDTGDYVSRVGTPAHIQDVLRLLEAAGPARDALDSALVPTGQDGADAPYLGGSFSFTGEVELPPTYPTPVTFPPAPALLDCNAAGAPVVAVPGDSPVAGGGSGAGGGEGPGVTVSDRPIRPGADVPATSDAAAGSQAFPLARVLAALGALLLLALVTATKPWRLAAARRQPDSEEDVPDDG